MLYGRDAELARIEALLDGARAGRSGALVLRGEAGIGKSALLEHVAAAATDMRVLRGTGVESEADLPFAGLHLLLSGVVDRIGRLPEPQADALRAALALQPAQPGSRYLVGLGVLTLLAELAEDGPVLCLADDAHWLDHGSAEALLFAARRLEAEGVVMLFVARDLHAPSFSSPGLAELRLGRLDDEAAAEFLAEHAGDLPRHVRAQILHESGGNPLALRELPVAQREGLLVADPYRDAARLPVHSRIQEIFADRIAALPEATQLALLVAAADSTGELAVVLPAAQRLGAGIDDLESAEDRQLVRTVEGRVAFRHPLMRTAVYQNATLVKRLRTHQALAEVFAERDDICQRAWHLAAASTGPDEEVAALLERAAEADQAVGGFGSVAAAYERAASMSPDPSEKVRRLTEAARWAFDSGQLDRAATLADTASALTGDPETRTTIAFINASVADEQNRPMEAHRILLDEACSLGAQPSGEQRTAQPLMFFYAVETAWMAGDFGALDRAARLAAEYAGQQPFLPVERLARAAGGLNHRTAGGVADGVAAVRELLDQYTQHAYGLGAVKLTPMLAWWHLLLGDHRTAHELAMETERSSRRHGAMGALPHALAVLARSQLHLGQHGNAKANATEGLRLAREIGQRQTVGYLGAVLAHLAALEGDEAGCTAQVDEVRGLGGGHSSYRASCAMALLDLGLGRHEATAERLTELAAGANRMDILSGIPDLVEAVTRLGKPEIAEEGLSWYTAWAEAAGQPWALAVLARCRALLATLRADESEIEQYFVTALGEHRRASGADGRDDTSAGAGDRPFERARTELVYGEWLRRCRRMSDARPHLRGARDTFERLGAVPWAERAAGELRATGESLASEADEAGLLGSLTPQEWQVVQLAATGMTNRDIGSQLFLSPRTVGYHLYKAYPKLGIASRAELGRFDWSAAR
ncbi:AAA family ATPase [Haloechinothrix sp. LS1_15]|uniref:helix-turn-helix transcriptional regulator n=1 Tax=Haloechinothrix sp. LS1_15 TaxID=2652248 RepID=UPI0029480D99|nr:AAA family ATPase [Haloechinothrix sp. LS1_15]MDV6011611.1 helix-turn-helix domain-containing protein [Haloechinothrix sp. LS1_15]